MDWFSRAKALVIFSTMKLCTLPDSHDHVRGPERETLILGPSLGTTAHLWDRARTWLEPALSVLAWDLPGHGSSPSAANSVSMVDLAHAVLEVADEAGLARFHYAGESIGGAVGLELARLAPERLASMTVVCSAAQIGSPAGWLDRAALVRAEGLAPVVDATPSRWFTDEFMAQNPNLVEEMLATLARTKAEDYAKMCEALSMFDARTWLHEIRVPTLVIAGDGDPVTPPEQGCVIATGVQNGRLEIVPGASHQAVVEQPERVATLLREFVDENS